MTTPRRSASTVVAVPSASGSSHHSASPPSGTRNATAAGAPDGRDEDVALLAQSDAVRGQHLVGAVHQLGQCQLLEDGRSEVEAHPRLEQPVHLRQRGAQPAQAQPAPVGLAGAADRDGGRRTPRRAVASRPRAPAAGPGRGGPRRTRRPCGRVASARPAPPAARRSSAARSGSGSRRSGRRAAATPGAGWRRGRRCPSRRDRRRAGTRRAPAWRSAWVALGYVGYSTTTRSPGAVKACATIALAARAPGVTMICSGEVGSPRASYAAAIRACSAGTPRGK